MQSLSILSWMLNHECVNHGCPSRLIDYACKVMGKVRGMAAQGKVALGETMRRFSEPRGDPREEYIAGKAANISELCERGFMNQILLSHDGLTFSGFNKDPQIKPFVPYEFLFRYLVPHLLQSGFGQEDIVKLTKENQRNMLLGV